jgi:hypothetical protein
MPTPSAIINKNSARLAETMNGRDVTAPWRYLITEEASICDVSHHRCLILAYRLRCETKTDADDVGGVS